MMNRFKLATAAFSLAALVLAAFSFAPAGSALAQAAAKPAASNAVTPVAAKHRKARAARSEKPAPARPVWNGPDPTKGPNVEYIRQQQAQGRCIIDEGYGRYSACSNL